LKLLPGGRGGRRRFEESENDFTRLSAHVDDVTDSGRGEVAELMRPFYLEYLQKAWRPARRVLTGRRTDAMLATRRVASRRVATFPDERLPAARGARWAP
jgi:hypothetical protein